MQSRGLVEGQHVIAEPAREMADEFPSYAATEISVVEAELASRALPTKTGRRRSRIGSVAYAP
jgi:hypothetical protein